MDALVDAWWQGYRAAWEDALSGMRIPDPSASALTEPEDEKSNVLQFNQAKRRKRSRK